MHIPHHAMMPASGIHSAAAAEKAAAAERASETRKKLLRSAAKIEGETNFEEFLIVGSWREQGSSRGQGQHGRSGELPGEEEEQGAEPVSFWA